MLTLRLLFFFISLWINEQQIARDPRGCLSRSRLFGENLENLFIVIIIIIIIIIIFSGLNTSRLYESKIRAGGGRRNRFVLFVFFSLFFCTRSRPGLSGKQPTDRCLHQQKNENVCFFFRWRGGGNSLLDCEDSGPYITKKSRCTRKRKNKFCLPYTHRQLTVTYFFICLPFLSHSLWLVLINYFSFLFIFLLQCIFILTNELIDIINSLIQLI